MIRGSSGGSPLPTCSAALCTSCSHAARFRSAIVAYVPCGAHDRPQGTCLQCAGVLRDRERVYRTVETMMGPMQLERPYFHCRSCRLGYYWKVRVIQKHKMPASIRHLVPGGFVASLMILIVLSCFSHTARCLLAGLVSLYIVANLGASLLTCRTPATFRYLPVLPLIFAAYHFGYGYGFLRGLVDFSLRRKGGSSTFSQLTRRQENTTDHGG